jgi:hypothetical protein
VTLRPRRRGIDGGNTNDRANSQKISVNALLCIRELTKSVAVSNIFLLLKHITHGKFWSQYAGSHLHRIREVNFPSLEAT